MVEESGIESKSARLVSSINIPRVGTYFIQLCSQEPDKQCPIDGIGIGRLDGEESVVESKSASIGTNLIIEVNSMDIYRVGMYLILLCS